jgi:hypothetical protein
MYLSGTLTYARFCRLSLGSIIHHRPDRVKQHESIDPDSYQSTLKLHTTKVSLPYLATIEAQWMDIYNRALLFRLGLTRSVPWCFGFSGTFAFFPAMQVRAWYLVESFCIVLVWLWMTCMHDEGMDGPRVAPLISDLTGSRYLFFCRRDLSGRSVGMK